MVCIQISAGPKNGVIAFTSVVTNALQLAVTSSQIEKLYYMYENSNMTGYVASRYSAFNIMHFSTEEAPENPQNPDIEQCLYVWINPNTN